jgi:hypothetical protein
MQLLKRMALVSMLLVNLVVLLGVLTLRAFPGSGRGGGEVRAAKNGDVNCDGRLNLADPVYLLQYLFNDGADTCAFAQEDPGPCCAELSSALAALQARMDAVASRVPTPTDIVAVDGKLRYPADGGTVTLLKVPDDKWFVLTSFAFSESVPPRIVLRANGQDTEVPMAPQAYGTGLFTWTTGVAFPPGSEVAASRGAHFNPPMPFEISFHINGYFTGG